MAARNLYVVGARLLGIYFVVYGLASLPGVYVAYEMAASTGTSNPTFYAAAVASQAVLFALAGIVLLLRQTVSDTDAIDLAPADSLLHVGLKLLGVFFTVAGLVTVAGSASEALVVPSRWSLSLTEIIPALLYASAGLLLLFRSRLVAQAIRVAA